MSTYLLLPPSEAKARGGNLPWDPGSDEIGIARCIVAARLHDFARTATVHDATKFYGISGVHLDRAIATASTGLIGMPAMSAATRYTGVVWQHLDIASLHPAAKKHAAKHAMVVSGLGGLLEAGSAIPDYRLKLGARLPNLGLVSAWWKPILAATAKSKFARHTVVDLLGNEQTAALDVAGIARHTVRVRFVTRTGAAAAGHAAKKAKGLLARSLLMHHAEDPVATCAEFNDASFRYLDSISTGPVTTVRIAATAA